MDRFSVYVPKLLPKKENFFAQFRSCPGCGQALAVRLISKAMQSHGLHPFGSDNITTAAASLPYDQWELPGSPRQKRSAGQSSKLTAGRTAEPVSMAGDSGTFEKGFAVLSEALKQGRRFLYICLFVESGITRDKQVCKQGYYPDATQTFKDRILHMQALIQKVKNLGLAFMATACPSYPFDLINKVKAAIDCEGPSFLAVFAPCPTGCLYDPSLSLHSGRLAVTSGFFPLFLTAEGACQMTVTVPKMPPVADYLKLQHSFKNLSPGELQEICETVKNNYLAVVQECNP